MNVPAQPVPDLWLLVLSLVVFSIFWCSIVALISVMGGWRSLAKIYRAEVTTFRVLELDDGKKFRWASMSMTSGPIYFPANYGNCLTIQLSSEGIGLKVWPLLRIIHPPLLIPWRDIKNCELETWLVFSWRATVYLNNRRQLLRFYGRAGNEIFDAWSQQIASKAGGAHATY